MRTLASWVFFIDRALGKHTVPEALRRAGAQVELHATWFAEDAPDADWLPVVAAKGWVILTKDAAIARRPIERMAVMGAGARLFAFNNAQVPGVTIAAAFGKALPGMLRVLAAEPAPFIAIVGQNGNVEVRLRGPG